MIFNTINNKLKIIIIIILIYGLFERINYSFFSFFKIPFQDINICMCSIVKKENLYLKDFINHYKLLGYNHFYIYDNNDKNEEKLNDIISEEINTGLITVIDFRGYRGKNGGPQMDAYYNCYDNYKHYCSWISFFDVDEFLILENDTSLKQLMENSRYKNCEGISVNWKIHHDNELLFYENISVKSRFKGIKENYKSNTTKLIARGNLKNNLKKSYSAHTLWYDIELCNSLGNRITPRFWITPHSYKYAYLSHYYTKTISEYIIKIKKGNVYYNFTLTPNILSGKFNTFFEVNNKTKQKVDIFNREFNTSFK